MNKNLELTHDQLVFLKWCMATVKVMPKDAPTKEYVERHMETVEWAVFSAIRENHVAGGPLW